MPRSGLVECFVQWVGEGNVEMVLTLDEEEDTDLLCIMPDKRSTRLEDVVPDLFTDADGDTSMDDYD
ncbi:hypothetical protein N0V85_003522 [Neurospora sp. IMI 360204]|nr:hypothetical protein N0V85_003522 [Neurospora sp. IMI 360204]